ncbi:MAG: hypothetical protein ACE5IR_10580 [bacterium]
MKERNYYLQTFLIFALASEFFYVIIALLGDLRAHIPAYLLCYAGAFIIYWIAAVTFFDFNTEKPDEHRAPAQVDPEQNRARWLRDFLIRIKKQEALSSKEILSIGIVFGVIFRITFLLAAPSLSDDIYRYIWDGKVSNSGINPFQYPPNADELTPLRDQTIYPKINHRGISTIYPPVNQFIFWATYRISPTVFAFKVTFVLFDLFTIALLFLLLKTFAIKATRILIYVWNPLIIVEIAGSAHSDIIGVFLLTLFLWLFVKRKIHWANVILAVSFLTKYITILFLPLLFFFKRYSKILIVLIFLVVVAMLYLPYADAEKRLFEGLFVYSDKWQFNGSIFELLLATIHPLLTEEMIVKVMITPYGYSPDAETIATRGVDLALLLSKLISAIIYTGIFSYYLFRFQKDPTREQETGIFRIGLILLGWFFLLNPTVQPWYLCWLLPLLVIVPERAWILLTGLVALSYWILIDYTKLGIWQLPSWVLWLEYTPFYALWFYDSASKTGRRKGFTKV